MIKDTDIFTEEEIANLRKEATNFALTSKSEDAAIEFAYTHAKKFGNTYTYDEAVTLLQKGLTANKQMIFAQMLVKLRDIYLSA